jgi:hypothetical protein
MSKVVKLALAAAVLASLVGGSIASAATSPAGGAIKVFVTNTSDTKGKILVTGAIGDYGTTLSTNKNGKVNANGNYEQIKLKHGSFEVNGTQLNKNLNKGQPQVNASTCSEAFIGSGPTTLLNGTGLYKGISGNVKITVTFAGIAPRFTSGAKKGQCNFSENAEPLGQYQSITGVGKVKFS